MKASEVSYILRKYAEILDLFGDAPLLESLDKLYSIAKVGTSGAEEAKTDKKVFLEGDSYVIDDALIEKMSRMNSDELTYFIQNSDVFKAKSALMYLADKLSITSSKRHNSETLKHFIITYFERGRMDDIIKNDRKNSD